MSRSVCIIYGFAEGNWHGQYLRRELETNNYKIESDPNLADIIFAHSAGVFYLPPTNPKQIVVLVGPPFWPGKPLVVSMGQKIWRDFIDHARHRRLGYWLRKTLQNLFYIFADPSKVWLIYRNAGRREFYLTLKNRDVTIIRNNHDIWLAPNVHKLLSKKADFKYFELPGEHDDCWLNPAPYMKVLKSIT